MEVLGTALLQSLWKMGILWLIYIMISGFLKKTSAAVRHLLALGLLIAGMFWFLLSLYSSLELIQPFGIPERILRFRLVMLPLLSEAYLITISFLMIRYSYLLFSSRRLKKIELRPAPPEWQLSLEKTIGQIQIIQNVKLYISNKISTPVTIGFFKPVILVPLATLNHLTIEQMETVLLHELAHIKRNDWLVNLLVSLIEILFFFNPFARLLIRAIKREREMSCDDLVLRYKPDSYCYASALLSLEIERNHSNPHSNKLAMAATGRNNKQLLQRILRITGNQGGQQHFQYWEGRSLLIAVFCMLGSSLFFQVGSKNKPVAPKQPGSVESHFAEFVSTGPVKKPISNKLRPVIITRVAEPLIYVATIAQRPRIRLISLKTNIAPAIEVNTMSPIVEENKAPSYGLYPYVPAASFSYQIIDSIKEPDLIQENQVAEAILKKALHSLNLEEISNQVIINQSYLRFNQVLLENEMNINLNQADSMDLDFKPAETIDEKRLEGDLHVQIQALQNQNEIQNVEGTSPNELSRAILKQQIKIQQETINKQKQLIWKLQSLNKKLRIVYI
jgi:Zn-dependent protease with chaperone function